MSTEETAFPTFIHYLDSISASLIQLKELKEREIQLLDEKVRLLQKSVEL